MLIIKLFIIIMKTLKFSLFSNYKLLIKNQVPVNNIGINQGPLTNMVSYDWLKQNIKCEIRGYA